MILICVMFFAGCDGCDMYSHKAKYNIERMDGCEYIVSHNAYGNILTHKGNCDNPIHIYNKK